MPLSQSCSALVLGWDRSTGPVMWAWCIKRANGGEGWFEEVWKSKSGREEWQHVKCQNRVVCSYTQGPQCAPPRLLRGKTLNHCNQWQMREAEPELCFISREGREEGTKDICLSGTQRTATDCCLWNEQMLFSSICYRLTFNKKRTHICREESLEEVSVILLFFLLFWFIIMSTG